MSPKNQTSYFLYVLQLFDNFMGLLCNTKQSLPPHPLQLFQSLGPHPLHHHLPEGTLFSDELSLTGYSGVAE